MAECGPHTTLLERVLADLAQAFPNLERDQIYRILRKAFDPYSSVTPVTNSPSATPSLEKATPSEPSSGTSLTMEGILNHVSQETLTLLRQGFAGLTLNGLEISSKIRILRNSHTTDTILIDLCVKNLVTGVTMEAFLIPWPHKPNSPDPSSNNSNPNTSGPTPPTSDGMNT